MKPAALWLRTGLWAVSVALIAACGSGSDTAPTGAAGTLGAGVGGAPTTSSSVGPGGSGGGGAGGAGASGGSGGEGNTGPGGAGGAGGVGAAGGAGGAGGNGPCSIDDDCSDGMFCNGDEVCSNGLCVSGAAPICDDGVSCTADSCDEADDVCLNEPDDAACDNGAYCDGGEACDPANAVDPTIGCSASAGSPCDDGISCTADTCDEVAESCAHAEVDAACDNGVACDGQEACDATLDCISSAPPSCDDSVGCTNDFCDLASDACAHVPQDIACSNGLFCDGTEWCDAVAGCQPGMLPDCSDGVACTTDGCDPGTDACEHVAVDAACGDGDLCNGAEVCAPSGCQPGSAVLCDDGRSCTADACSNAQMGCVFTPNDAFCSNGLDCDGQETCGVDGPAPTGCVQGAPIPCGPDGIACTVDACNEANDTCEHTPNNGACPPGQFCVIPQGGCTAAQPCMGNAECNDGNACNGVEVCSGGVCQPGLPVDCDDGSACTVDTCDPGSGACAHAPNDGFCNDGFVCNGVETCVGSPGAGCLEGVSVNCDDGVACSVDQCQEPDGTCVNILANIFCSDGQLCNGFEVCTPSGCQPGAPFVCPPDGIACTTEVCDPDLNLCMVTPDNTLCPCGQTCDPQQGGCGSFCVASTCQGKTYQCGDCLDNDGDCAIDSADSQCLGPCDNTEDSFYGGIPGQNNSPCKSDCYFDQDTGSGNDDCYWSHKCDPLEVAPNYPPEGSQCEYNPNASIPGYGDSCATAFMTQSNVCLGYCGPLTPNGCDCFGCCSIPGAPTTVWLGTENPDNVGSCNLMSLGDPALCAPCTQVPACLNTCEICEICINKPTLPPECSGVQDCPGGVQQCGQAGQAPCPVNFTCITGCCQANPD